MSSFYFAYGSNMNPARVRERGLGVQTVLPGVLSALSEVKQAVTPGGIGG